jgi:hypothetical protein
MTGLLLAATLSSMAYPFGLVLGGTVLALLISREFLDTVANTLALRWERALRLISLPLALLFVVSVAVHIAT